MPSYRNFTIQLLSQYDARAVPEYPASTVTGSSPLSPTGTAEVYIPIYPNSQFWVHYTCPENESKFYYFKLLVNGEYIASWGVGEEAQWQGRVVFLIFDGGLDPEGRRILQKRALVFPADHIYSSGAMRGSGRESSPFASRHPLEEGNFEIQIFRSSGRRMCEAHCEAFMGTAPGSKTIRMKNAGKVKAQEPKRQYRFALIDPKDTPFVRFVYRFLKEEDVPACGLSSPQRQSPGPSRYPSLSAPDMPKDKTSNRRHSISPRLRLVPVMRRPDPQSPIKKLAGDENRRSFNLYEGFDFSQELHHTSPVATPRHLPELPSGEHALLVTPLCSPNSEGNEEEIHGRQIGEAWWQMD